MNGQGLHNHVNMHPLQPDERPPDVPESKNDLRHVTGPTVHVRYKVNDKVEVFHGIWHTGVVTSVDSNVQVKTMIRRMHRGVGGGAFDQEMTMVIHNNQLTEFIRKPVLYSLREKVELYDNKSWVGGRIVAKKKDEMTIKFDIQTDPENIVGAYLNPRAIRNLVRKIDTHSKGSLRNKFIPQGPDFEGLQMLKTHSWTYGLAADEAPS